MSSNGVVCGFAFDPLAGEAASTLGRPTILQARMNPDIAAWFLDTDFDVADITDEARPTVNSAVSRRFPLPSKGNFAIEIINYDGDEMMKVVKVT